MVGVERVVEAEGRGMRCGFWAEILGMRCGFGAGQRKTSDLVEGPDVWVVDVMS